MHIYTNPRSKEHVFDIRTVGLSQTEAAEALQQLMSSIKS